MALRVANSPLPSIGDDDGALVTAREIAEALGVHRRTVYEWMERDGFPEPAEQRARGRVWRVEEVAEWYNARSAESRARGYRGPRSPDDEYRCPLPRGCGHVKPKPDFYAPRTKSTEVSHYCKSCRARHAREARQREREAELARRSG